MKEKTQQLGTCESLQELSKLASEAQLECLEELAQWDRVIELAQSPVCQDSATTSTANPLALWESTDWIVSFNSL